MKKILMMLVIVATAVFVVGAQEIPLADARAKIGEVIDKPAELTSLMRQLSAADQKSFVGEVNAAIAKMPGSNESRAAMFLNANRAMLKGAKKGNLAVLLAEVFATVPIEALTIINERFASDLFNRSADPSVVYTDEKFTEIAVETMKTICERTATSDNAAIRDTMAALMFIRASNGSPADLTDTLVQNLPAESREVAKTVWIPAALAADEAKSYDAMLGAADAGTQPSSASVLYIAGPQLLDALLTDLNNNLKAPDRLPPMTSFSQAASSTAKAVTDRSIGIDRTPTVRDNEAHREETVRRIIEILPEEEDKPDEPGGYQNQNTH